MKYDGIDFSDIEQKYHSLEKYIQQMALGNLRSLIVNGPPGVGKTYSTSSYLKKYSSQKQTTITGHMTNFKLYVELYRHKSAEQILILDDVDSVMSDVKGLNILKGAMDTGESREINWESSTTLLSALNVPTSFHFKGGVILITNTGFGGGSKKHISHLNALKDRSYCLHLGDRDQETVFRYICYAITQRDILKEYKLSESQKFVILEFIEQHMYSMHSLSLRSLVKCAELMCIDPINWKDLALNGLVKV